MPIRLIIRVGLRGNVSEEIIWDSGLRLEPDEGGRLNDYAYAVELYGPSRRYRYFWAVELLELGNMVAARRMYQAHRRDYEPVYIDDFDFLWAHKLADQGRLGDALVFVREEAGRQTNAWRRAYFHYLEGELLLNEQRYEAARRAAHRLEQWPPHR